MERPLGPADWPRRRATFRGARWLALLLAAALGCGPVEPELPALYSVTGQVLKNGLPVEGGFVRFDAVREQAVILVTAAVDQEGHFELTTRQGHRKGTGAPAGTYRVTYTPPQLSKTSFPVTSKRTYNVEPRAKQFIFEVGGPQPF